MIEKDLFVPGRLALIGEHSDWAGQYRLVNPDIEKGYGIVAIIEKGIYASVKKCDSFVVNAFSESINCMMDSDMLLEVAKSDNFFSYACGVAKYINNKYTVGGVEINVTKMDLPIKKGLSSSAAICVLVARAFNVIYDLNLTAEDEIVIAYHGEHIALSSCGRLDQVCAYGSGLMSLEFDGDDVNVEKIDIIGKFYFVVADLMSSKDTKKIFESLNIAYPFPHNDLECKLHEVLGVRTKEFAIEMIASLRNGKAAELGELLTNYQIIFDEITIKFCPSELTAPKLHMVLDDETVKKLSYGGKGVGSQGDGTVQILAKDFDSQKALIAYLNNELNLEAYGMVIEPSCNHELMPLKKTIKF